MKPSYITILVLGALFCVKLWSFAGQEKAKPREERDAFPGEQSLQSGIPLNTALLELRDDKACVSLFAGMSGGPELQTRTSGRGVNVKKHFYFHGSEVLTFPQPVKVFINLLAECKGNQPSISFAWPEFSRHLHFIFHWNLEPANGAGQSTPEVQPSSTSSQDSIWKEDSSTKQIEFTLPAAGVPILTELTIDVFFGDRRLKTFALHL